MPVDKRIQEILNLLDVEKNPFPSRLSLDEQGIFVLGYYHQRAHFISKTMNPLKQSNRNPNSIERRINHDYPHQKPL